MTSPVDFADARTGICSPPLPGPGPWPLPDLVARFRASVQLPGRRLTVAGAALCPDAARAACIGEGVERYAALVGRTPDAIASAAGLAQVAQPHLAPSALEVAEAPALDAPLAWLTARDGRQVPLAAARGDLLGTAPAPERFPHGSTGLAAGSSVPVASDAAAAEVVERDVVSRAWAGDRPLPRVAASALPTPLRRATERAGVDVALHLLPAGDSGAVVGLVALRDGERGYLGVGAAYRPDRTVALTKAWLEAVVSLAQAAELDSAETGHAVADAAGLLPWRPDRRYAAAGWAGVTDIAQHTQLLLDPAVADPVWQRLSGPLGPASPSRPGPPASRLVRDLFADVVEVDLTPPDLTAAGGPSVVRVLAVGAQPVRPAGLAPEALPCPLI